LLNPSPDSPTASLMRLRFLAPNLGGGSPRFG
jgi:hypothetical protein